MPGPLVAYLGHHKCGTIWITNIFNAVCAAHDIKTKHAHDPALFDHDLGVCREQEGFDALIYTNSNYRYVRGQNVLGFHVVRDPRDVIVSGYFSHLHSHPDNIWPELKVFRPLIQNLDKSAGLIMEMEFATDWMMDMRSWPEDAANILPVKFEDLIDDPRTWYRRIFEHLRLLNERFSAEQLNEIIEQFSYKNMAKGRAPGKEDASSHFRKGVPGDWINHFTPAHVWLFKRRYNDLLVKYGYEPNDLWEGLERVRADLTAMQKIQLAKAQLVEALRRVKRDLSA